LPLAIIFRAFGAARPTCPLAQGRRALLRSALAPGYHIPRLWRCSTYLPAGPGATRLAALSACPWLSYSAPSALLDLLALAQGRCASLRSALAPGYHIPRLWRCSTDLHAGPGAMRFAALSACPWLSYSAPLALLDRLARWLRGDASRFARHLPLAIICRAFGAGRPEPHLKMNPVRRGSAGSK
jgi:hypothetical protein